MYLQTNKNKKKRQYFKCLERRAANKEHRKINMAKWEGRGNKTGISIYLLKKNLK